MTQPDVKETRREPMRIRVRMSHNLIPPDCPGTIWALVELASTAVKREAHPPRLPLNLSLVLDRSGSMAGPPLEYVKGAARFVVEQVGAGDRFSLVAFDDQVNVVCPAQPVTHKDRLKSLIGSIGPGGSTNLAGGLLRGYQEALAGARPGQVNRVILLTDGMANVGITDASILSAKVRSMLAKGVSVSTIGVGLQFNEDLLLALAESGSGNYYYVSDPDAIPGVFATELQGLLKVVAQGIRLTATGQTGCAVSGILGYEPSPVPAGVLLDLPDMHENESKVLALELAHPSLPAGEHELLKLGLDYADCLGNLDAVSVAITVRLTAEDGPADLYRPNVDVIRVVELTRAAVVKDQVADALDEGGCAKGQRMLEENLDALRRLQAAHPEADPEVHQEIQELTNLLGKVKDAAAAPPPTGQDGSALRKDLRWQSYQGRRGTRQR